MKIACRLTLSDWCRRVGLEGARPRTTTNMYLVQMCINPSIPCISPIQKKSSLFLNFTPYFHDYKKLLLSFEFYPLFSRAGVNYSFGKTLARALHLLWLLRCLHVLLSSEGSGSVWQFRRLCFSNLWIDPALCLCPQPIPAEESIMYRVWKFLK